MYLVGKISEFPGGEKGYAAADIDRDGYVDSLDFAYMRKYLLGKGTMPPAPTPTPTPTATTSPNVITESGFEFDLDTGTIVKYVGTSTTVMVPGTINNVQVKAIGEKAFSGRYLISVTIPKGVTSIGNNAFSGCGSLRDITLYEGIIDIGDYAFYRCENLESITLPDSVVTIGKYAFSSCNSLTHITMPNSLTGIEEGMFKNAIH